MRFNRKTVFCDIDGTIFKHKDDLSVMISEKAEVLPGVVERFLEWREKDYYIILTTARPEGCRLTTEKQLHSFGIFYDKLVMGLPIGPRVVINDKKSDGRITSYAVCIDRDCGLKDVEI